MLGTRHSWTTFKTNDCKWSSSSYCCAITTSCYNNAFIYWYKQLPNKAPIFILIEFTVGKGTTEDEFKDRFSSTLDSTSRTVPLMIKNLRVSDSAVYYCALRPTVTETHSHKSSGRHIAEDKITRHTWNLCTDLHKAPMFRPNWNDQDSHHLSFASFSKHQRKY